MKLTSLVVLCVFLFSMFIVYAEDAGNTMDAEDSSAGADRRVEHAAARHAIARRIAAVSGSVVQDSEDATSQPIPRWRVNRFQTRVQANTRAQEILSRLDEEKTEVLMHLPRAVQNRLLAMNNESITERLRNLTLVKIDKDRLFKAREIAGEKLKMAEERFKLAKERFIQANNRYQERRLQFLDTKNKLKECEGQDTEECNELREKIIEHAKELLDKSIDRMMHHLEKVKEKINSAENLPEDEAEEAIAKIDEALAELEALKEKLAEADTKEEVMEVARKLRELWRDLHIKVLRYQARLVHAKVGEIIQRSEHLEAKLDCVLAQIEDTGAIDAKIDEFSEKVAEARAKFDEAKGLFTEAGKSSVDQGKQLVREAHELLKEAHVLLKEIVSEIREAGGELSSCQSQEIYEVVETGETEET